MQKNRSWYGFATTWIIRLLLLGIFLFMIAVFLTAVMSGNGPAQKVGIERIFSSLTGKPAAIHTLNDYRIFPDFKMDFSGLALTHPEGGPLLIVETVKYVQDSLQHFMGGAPLVQVEIDNLITEPGYLGPYSLHLTHAGIEPLAEGVQKGPTIFKAVGNYGGYPLEIRVPFFGERGRVRVQYDVNIHEPVVVELGGLMADFMLRIEPKAILLSDLHVQSGDHKLSGRMALSRRSEKGGEVSPPSFELRDDAQGWVLRGTLQDFSTTITGTGEFSSATLPKDLGPVLPMLVKILSAPLQTDLEGRKITPAGWHVTLQATLTQAITCADLGALSEARANLVFNGTRIGFEDLQVTHDGTVYHVAGDLDAHGKYHFDRVEPVGAVTAKKLMRCLN